MSDKRFVVSLRGGRRRLFAVLMAWVLRRSVRCAAVVAATVLILSACGSRPPVPPADNYPGVESPLVVFLAKEEAGGVLAEYRFYRPTSSAEKRNGLTAVSELSPGVGMLFLYDSDVRYAFTMEGMAYDIDILFLEAVQDGSLGEDYFAVSKVVEARIGQEGISAGGSYRAVLEIPAGDAKRLGIREGGVMAFSPTSVKGNKGLLAKGFWPFRFTGIANEQAVSPAKLEEWRAGIRTAFLDAVSTLSKPDFKRRLFRRLVMRGYDRLATESALAVEGLRAPAPSWCVPDSDPDKCTIPVVFDPLYNGGEASTGCGAPSPEEKIVVNLNMRSLEGKGHAYLVGTIAHELVHRVGNPYEGGASDCYRDTGPKIKMVKWLRRISPRKDIEQRNRFTYIVGGLVCEINRKDSSDPCNGG